MDLQNCLKEILRKQGYTYELLGEKLGFKAPRRAVSDRLNKPSALGTSNLLEFLDILNCELVIRSKMRGHEEWVIDAAVDTGPRGRKKPEPHDGNDTGQPSPAEEQPTDNQTLDE